MLLFKKEILDSLDALKVLLENYIKRLTEL